MDSSNSYEEQLEEKRRFWKQHIEDWQTGENQTAAKLSVFNYERN